MTGYRTHVPEKILDPKTGKLKDKLQGSVSDRIRRAQSKRTKVVRRTA